MSPQENESKFLLRENSVDYFLADALARLYPSIEALRTDVLTNGQQINQGYLNPETGLQILKRMGQYLAFEPAEARLRNRAGKLTFTIKGKGSASRSEMEAEIPQELFDEYWPLTEGARVEKVRLPKPYGNHLIEIDVYTDRDLIVAEVEAGTAEELKEVMAIGQDITEDNKYKNKNLAR